jgi:proline iminopeptidase
MISASHAFPLVALATCLSLAACSGDAPERASTDSTARDGEPVADMPLAAGEARLAVDGGRIWSKVSGADTGTPIILLHGGPGFNSFYLKPFEALGDDRAVVRYDQLGGGKSDGMTDTATMNIPHFVEELEALRAHLGYDKVHILGHSWGSMLAMEYYRAHPSHVASLSLGGSVMSVPEYAANAKKLVSTLSDSAQRAIREGEAAGKYDSPAYQAAMGEFYGKYVWLRPVQADLDSTMNTVNERIYNYMQGPSEFTINGTFKDYDATSVLRTVKVPTLYFVGEFDEVGADVVKRHAALTPGSTYARIPDAAHLTTWDNPVPTVAAVRAHLRKADR